MPPFPALPEDLEPTRATLHAYAHAVGVIPRTHAISHPKWWHISLQVQPHGLATESMLLPDGRSFWVRMDLHAHSTVIDVSDGSSHAIDMGAGLTATEFGDRLVAAVGELGLDGEYDRDRYVNDDPRPYDPAVAASYFDALVHIERTMEAHRSSLEGSVGPIQMWPHGFDLAFEWFGTRVEKYEENGEMVEYPSQLNFGFYPGGRAYFYSNPWPFDGPRLTSIALPHGAEWHTEGWEGTILYYDLLAGDPDGPAKLVEFGRAVHAAAAPTLTA